MSRHRWGRAPNFGNSLSECAETVYGCGTVNKTVYKETGAPMIDKVDQVSKGQIIEGFSGRLILYFIL